MKNYTLILGKKGFVTERRWINPNRNRGLKVKPKVKESKLRYTSTNPSIPKFQIHSEKTGPSTDTLPTYYAFTDTVRIPNQNTDLIPANPLTPGNLNVTEFTVSDRTVWKRYIWSVIDVEPDVEGVFYDKFTITVKNIP